MISKELTYKIANLARITITEAEAERHATEMSKIFGYVEKFNEVDISGVEPMTHVHGSENICRDDVVHESMSIEEVLQNAPDVNGQFFKVPIIKDHNVDN